jgi:hypothetical protein
MSREHVVPHEQLRNVGDARAGSLVRGHIDAVPAGCVIGGVDDECNLECFIEQFAGELSLHAAIRRLIAANGDARGECEFRHPGVYRLLRRVA